MITGALAFRSFAKLALPTYPEGERLGRIGVGKMDVSTLAPKMPNGYFAGPYLRSLTHP